MSRSNAGAPVRGASYTTKPPREALMGAYDSLPKGLRQAVANCLFDIDPFSVHTMLLVHGERMTITMMREAEADMLRRIEMQRTKA